MPGRLFLSAAHAGALGLDDPVRWQEMAPGDAVPARIAQSADLEPMRWGMIPVGRRNARGRPVMETIVNARSETLFEKTAFEGTSRAAVPVTGWYEWTGKPRRKTRWAITDGQGAPLWLAAIWDIWSAPGGHEVRSLATVTTEPNADVEPVHHRMPLVLGPNEVALWLGADPEAARAVMRPLDVGRLRVAQAPET